jgi:predicted GNAT family acetyltransferase
MGLTLVRHADVDGFVERVGDWLTEREAEHNLILGIVGSLLEEPGYAGGEPAYLASIEDAGATVAAAIRTPPWRAVLSEVDDRAAIELLADDIGASQPDLPGVVGPSEHVGILTEKLARRLGLEARPTMSDRAFRLTAVRLPAPVPGFARLAGPDDRAIVTAWSIAFEREAFGELRSPGAMEARVDHALAGGGSRRMWLWVDGEPVSMTGVGGPTPHGLRIGPVYTPPPQRRRGYASACVAAASQAALDSGRTFCFLFTDLANPTSNHIYQELGYEPVRDIDEWSLIRSSGS